MRGFDPIVLMLPIAVATGAGACDNVEVDDRPFVIAQTFDVSSTDYCELPQLSEPVLTERPSDSEQPIDDVNWFARPVPHAGPSRIVAFASHDQNYLYDLTRGVRIKIPDRSDAVATPDGRYMTVPSFYTPDSHIRFYLLEPLLASLEGGKDALDIEPVFIHDHPSMNRVYYQSTAVVSEMTTDDRLVITYRLMFSGTADESLFRIVDYVFTHDRAGQQLLSVEPSAPMRVCPEVHNDLNTPFISKDGRYIAAYTSESGESLYTPGASLKIFQIVSADPTAGSTSCRQVVDFGYAAGKADFSFDGTLLTFHISQGAYLTPFINGGLPSGTITDVVVAALEVDDRGNIVGTRGERRLTTSVEAGVGSYFPAFFPDGSLFYVANSVPKDGEGPKRFHLRVMDPTSGPWQTGGFETDEQRAQWNVLARHWEKACVDSSPGTETGPFPFKTHEAHWLGLSLTKAQCHALVADARAASTTDGESGWESVAEVCSPLPG